MASLLDRPVVAVDVGSRDGVRESWRALGPNAVLVGFDPDPQECARLNARAAGPAEERYEPFALGAKSGPATLNVTRDPQSSSLYEPSAAAIGRHPELWRHEPLRTEEIVLTTLDDWARDSGIAALDALKVDVQGAELDVLRGGEGVLAGARIVEAEVEFQELYGGQPLFCEVSAHLRAAGFVLWRLRELHHATLAPAGRGEPVFGVGDYVERTRLGGRLAWGNAVFVKEEMGESGADASNGARGRAMRAWRRSSGSPNWSSSGCERGGARGARRARADASKRRSRPSRPPRPRAAYRGPVRGGRPRMCAACSLRACGR